MLDFGALRVLVVEDVSLLVRQDVDGFAFYFMKLAGNAFERLATLSGAPG